MDGTFRDFLIKTLYVFLMKFGVVFRSVTPHGDSWGFPGECGLGAQGRGKGRGSVYKYEMLGGFRGLERQLGGFERIVRQVCKERKDWRDEV